jgi:integrase
MEHPNPPGRKRKQISKVFTAKNEAEAWELFDAWKVEMRAKFKVIAKTESELTIQMLFNHWEKWQKKRIRAKLITQESWDAYKAPFLNILPVLGRINVNDLNEDHLQDFFDHIMEEEDYEDSYIFKHFSFFKMLYEFGVREEKVNRNIPKILYGKGKIIIPKGDGGKIKAFEADEAQKLLDETEDNYLLHAIIYFALETGLRRGEILGLTWPKVQGGLIKVEQQLKKIGKRFVITDRLKSTYSYRQFYASEGVVKFLEKHKWIQNEQKKLLGDTYEDHNLVFCWDDGKPVDPNLVTKWFRETARKIGLRGHGLHSCRHTFATNMAYAGIMPKDLSVILGHHDAAFTYRKYVHAFEGAKKEAAERYSQYRQRRPLVSKFFN